MQRFYKRVGIVTGAGNGIGRASALAFADEGASLICSDISQEAGEETVQTIRRRGGNAIFSQGDVADVMYSKRLVEAAVSDFQSLDFAFNNAGIDGDVCPLTQMSEQDWDRVIDVNLKGVWAGLKYQMIQMRRQGKGAIVNTGSTASLAGYRTLGAYVATKHGVAGLSKVAALEGSLDGIRVNCVCPGIIETKMSREYAEQNPAIGLAMAKQQPMHRWGQPEEVAQAVLWLCSDQASFVTGAMFVVDGGLSAQFSQTPAMPSEH